MTTTIDTACSADGERDATATITRSDSDDTPTLVNRTFRLLAPCGACDVDRLVEVTDDGSTFSAIRRCTYAP